MAAQYGPLDTPAQIREKRLAGIALYTPRLNEIQYPQATPDPRHPRPHRGPDIALNRSPAPCP